MLEIFTPRLRLIAFTAESAAAAIADRARFAQLLSAAIPGDWPPVDLADVQGAIAAKLTADPTQTGWCGWYVIAKPGIVGPEPTLIGSAGCGSWGASPTLLFGYGLLPAFFRQGFASEAARAVIEWAFRQPGVTRVEATTFERHIASVKILERCGFIAQGVSPDDAAAPESDRQGRGRLIHFVCELPSSAV